jgi:hypothetical protein
MTSVLIYMWSCMYVLYGTPAFIQHFGQRQRPLYLYSVTVSVTPERTLFSFPTVIYNRYKSVTVLLLKWLRNGRSASETALLLSIYVRHKQQITLYKFTFLYPRALHQRAGLSSLCAGYGINIIYIIAARLQLPLCLSPA